MQLERTLVVSELEVRAAVISALLSELDGSVRGEPALPQSLAHLIADQVLTDLLPLPLKKGCSMRIENEIDRIWDALRTEPEKHRHRELYGAMQALGWALDPKVFRAPFDLIASIPLDSPDCLGADHQTPLSETSAPIAGAA
jgi:hypothetical protein